MAGWLPLLLPPPPCISYQIINRLKLFPLDDYIPILLYQKSPRVFFAINLVEKRYLQNTQANTISSRAWIINCRRRRNIQLADYVRNMALNYRYEHVRNTLNLRTRARWEIFNILPLQQIHISTVFTVQCSWDDAMSISMRTTNAEQFSHTDSRTSRSWYKNF